MGIIKDTKWEIKDTKWEIKDTKFIYMSFCGTVEPCPTRS